MSTPIEFERKFLVHPSKTGDLLATAFRSEELLQAYFTNADGRCVRLRKREAGWLLTFKAATGEVGQAFEVETRVDDVFAAALLPLCTERVHKRRHYIWENGFGWEVDEFLDHNAGLVLAECELADAEQSERLSNATPRWVSSEVTGDGRFFNTWLAANKAPLL